MSEDALTLRDCILATIYASKKKECSVERLVLTACVIRSTYSDARVPGITVNSETLYSPEVMMMVMELVREGLVETYETMYPYEREIMPTRRGPAVIVKLTRRGKKEAKRVWKRLGSTPTGKGLQGELRYYANTYLAFIWDSLRSKARSLPSVIPA